VKNQVKEDRLAVRERQKNL
jgi:hypothetical protein